MTPIRASGSAGARALTAFVLPSAAAFILWAVDTLESKRPVYARAPGDRVVAELCIAGNFVEVFLAREGHDDPECTVCGWCQLSPRGTPPRGTH
jgi:hypothetical protein